MASNRDKRATFVRLAEARVNKALNALRLIGNLSNRNNYEFDDSDANRIITALESELRYLRQQFIEKERAKNRPEFKL